MTLIEMMVALVIGMVLSLGVFSMLAVGEGRKRATTSANDIDQASGYAMFVMDRLIRGAGAGFASAGSFAYGCTVHAAKGGNALLPAAAPLPSPFDAVNTGTPGVFRLAPVLIAPGQTVPHVSGQPSDVLVVMGGSGGAAAYPVEFRGAPTETALDLPNTLGFSGDDLVLVSEPAVPQCMVQQVRSGYSGSTANSLPLAGSYAAAVVDDAAVTAYTSGAAVMNIGNVVHGNPPAMQLIGVGDGSTLYSYDLLQTAGASTPRAQPIADAVFELHALYGVDPAGTGTITWVSPDSPTYNLASLMAGTPAAAQLLQSIKAVRLGVIMRAAANEKSAVSQPSLTMFDDLLDADGHPLSRTRTLSAEERLYRYRVVESTIPIRNNML
jgi:type IV pilus assembly protein PilW